MKIVLRASVALAALVSMSGAAHAQSHSSAQIHYANPVVGATGTYDTPLSIGEAFGIIGNEILLANGIGTRYTATSTAPDNTEAPLQTVSNTFTLTGSVSKDCSFYAGNTNAGRTLNFGVIGVKTGNNENVGAAFEMAGPLSANIETLTAGCNFNNEVVISKGNQFGDGMNLQGNPGGFDVTQFQSNIPYSVTATWSGVALDAVTQGTPQSLVVASNAASGTKQQGAWRSAMNIAINAPAITNRGLVAGTYQDTLTVRLSAL